MSTTQHISAITSEIVHDSRGQETIAVTVHAGDTAGTYTVPCGASVSQAEPKVVAAHHARALIHDEIAPQLTGMSVHDIAAIDAALHTIDGETRFARIGGNTAIGISAATVCAAAAAVNMPLWAYIRELLGTPPHNTPPRLFVNLINGGAHAGSDDTLQEYHFIPDVDDPALALAAAVRAEDALGALAARHGDELRIGDEGGVVLGRTTLPDTALSLLRAAGEEAGVSFLLGVDAAANSMRRADGYSYYGEHVDTAALLEKYAALAAAHSQFTFLEDPFAESDLPAFATLRARADSLAVIGDDITATNQRLCAAARDAGALDAVIVKPNQAGTMTEVCAVLRDAAAHNIRCIVSHRSGETMDTFIADLAFGAGAYGIKAGAPRAPERKVKYERLVAIASER